MPRLSKIGAAALAAFGWTSGSAVSASYLVVGGGSGGGAAGGGGGGGGGAGGYRTGTASLNPTLSYTVTVGAGGAAGATGQAGATGDGTSGSDSIFSTITSTGGGGGAAGGLARAGKTGGSGGGGGHNGGAGGAGNTPSTSPSQGNNGGTPNASHNGGGGGGGASAVGATTPSAAVGGDGGAGTASSISGSSVTYAGGGGGASNGTGGAGGAGGGGAGASGGGGTGVAGTANLGGGGGGGYGSSGIAAAGGSGVVIISYVGAQQFGGGVVTTDGTNTIHTFTTSGTLVPATPLTAQFLVVGGGGGGGGGGGFGGGGGAGGFLSTTGYTIDTNSNYVVTVGAGGAASTGGNGGSGTLSSFLTLTAAGGGYGGGFNTVGASGGSGGGGGESQNGGSGNTPSTTPSQGSNGGKGSTTSNGGGGGGGGASAVGGSPTNSSGGGAGGAGSASSISGTSTYYAGGGAGCSATSPIPSGGTGGGGNGTQIGVANAVAGTANTGGGGGGGYLAAAATGAAGGSGIVIIAYPGSTQQMAGGTVTISGGNVIHTFTSSGYLTPIKYASRSLRFRSSASAYISRTPATTTNRRTWTWSGWVKRGALGSVTRFFSADNGAQQTLLRFQADNTLQFQIYNSGVAAQIITTQVFRDPSAWYHIVAVMNTTDATSANRMVLYINGVQVTALSTASYPSQNYDAFVNQTILHSTSSSGTAEYWDGYLTEVNFVDGAALTPSSFGTFNSYGVWQPITYGGSYGTNGFYLTFGNNTSTTTLGYDTSPQGNNWTTNNISLTAGVTYDSMTDVPTLTSATVTNYATWNPLSANATVTNGNLQAATQTGGSRSVVCTLGVRSEKYYAEMTVVSTTGTSMSLGVVASAYDPLNVNLRPYSYGDGVMYNQDGTKSVNGTSTAYGATYTNGDVIGIAIDFNTNQITFYKNNTSQGSIAKTFSGDYLLCLGSGTGTGAQTATLNCGQQPFTYNAPSGFVALNTYNLSTPTIPNGAVYMAATLYTGNGSTQAVSNVVNGVSMQPDFVWVKSRSNAYNHLLYDSIRGAGKALISNSTSAEGGNSADLLGSFNSNGFSVNNTFGGGSDPSTNGNAATYVGWQWKANGAGVSNTSGSITSTVSVNTTAGFSIVLWTGNGLTAATVGHGLNVVPAMIICKERTGTDYWHVKHQSTASNTNLYLNVTNASTSAATVGDGILADLSSSTTFGFATAGSPGNVVAVNENGVTNVAYCFAAVAGYSAFGSYTGNGSSDGPFVYLGFRPRFVLWKRTDAVANWFLLDSTRTPANPVNLELYADQSSAETTFTDCDFVSNGFKLRTSNTDRNASGGTYIYMAFAENPFKYSNAR